MSFPETELDPTKREVLRQTPLLRSFFYLPEQLGPDWESKHLSPLIEMEANLDALNPILTPTQKAGWVRQMLCMGAELGETYVDMFLEDIQKRLWRDNVLNQTPKITDVLDASQNVFQRSNDFVAEVIKRGASFGIAGQAMPSQSESNPTDEPFAWRSIPPDLP